MRGIVRVRKKDDAAGRRCFSGLSEVGRDILIRLLHEWTVAIVPFGEDHWRQAADAYTRYGRGHHKAGLNLGDCLAYAVAKLADQPLLCVGDDFAKTDLALA